MATCASEEPILTGLLTKQGNPRFRLLHKSESFCVVIDASSYLCSQFSLEVSQLVSFVVDASIISPFPSLPFELSCFAS